MEEPVNQNRHGRLGERKTNLDSQVLQVSAENRKTLFSLFYEVLSKSGRRGRGNIGEQGRKGEEGVEKIDLHHARRWQRRRRAEKEVSSVASSWPQLDTNSALHSSEAFRLTYCTVQVSTTCSVIPDRCERHLLRPYWESGYFFPFFSCSFFFFYTKAFVIR